MLCLDDPENACLFDDPKLAQEVVAIMNHPENWEVVPVREHTPSASGEGY